MGYDQTDFSMVASATPGNDKGNGEEGEDEGGPGDEDDDGDEEADIDKKDDKLMVEPLVQFSEAL